MKRIHMGMASLGMLACATLALADHRYDLENCNQGDTVCVGLVLLDAIMDVGDDIMYRMDRNKREILDAITYGGGGGGGGQVGGRPPQSGYYSLTSGSINRCEVMTLSSKSVSGNLREIGITCLRSQQVYQLECSNNFTCSDGTNSIEIYDNNIIEANIARQSGTYNLSPHGAVIGEFGDGEMDLALPGSQSIDIPIDVELKGFIKKVSLELMIETDNASDFDDYFISLIHPNGTTIPLQNADNGNGALQSRANRHVQYGDTSDVKIDMSAHHNLPSEGRWVVRIYDEDSDQGTLKFIKLHFSK